MLKRKFYVLCNEAGDGGAGGASAGGGEAAGAGSGATGAAGAGGDGGAASTGSASTGSVLASGAAADGGATSGAAAAGEVADPNAWAPEKHRVFGEDGKTLNVEATARKIAEAYGHAEKRIGSGDVPPKSAADYKINVPEALADKIKAEDLAKSEDFKGFLGKMHEAGLSQKQADSVVAEMLDRSMKLQAGMAQISADECVAQLKTEWASEADYKANLGKAFQAAKAYGDVDKLMEKYGNDPDFIRFAARVGKDMGEDTGAPNDAQSISEPDVEALQKSKAYWDPSDPEHAKTKARVEQFYAGKFGSKPKTSGSIGFASLPN